MIWRVLSLVKINIRISETPVGTGWSNTYHFCDYTINNCPKILKLGRQSTINIL
jgi:hypothetical protein